jgi:APA family basic amino acid/polyamine antiporter
VKAPDTTIRRGTLIGYALGTFVFLLTALAVAGSMPNADVASSARPIALAVERTAGPVGATIIGLGAIAAATGTLNGWILMVGRIPLSAAEDGVFFPRLAKLHPRFGTPYVGLIVGSAVAGAMLCLMFSRTLLQVFNFIVLLAVLTTLFPHLYATAAELMLSRRDPGRYSRVARRRAQVIAPIAFVFVLYTMYGVGAEVAMWGFLVILAGTPLYIWFKTRSAASRA